MPCTYRQDIELIVDQGLQFLGVERPLSARITRARQHAQLPVGAKTFAIHRTVPNYNCCPEPVTVKSACFESTHQVLLVVAVELPVRSGSCTDRTRSSVGGPPDALPTLSPGASARPSKPPSPARRSVERLPSTTGTSTPPPSTQTYALAPSFAYPSSRTSSRCQCVTNHGVVSLLLTRARRGKVRIYT